MEGDGVRMREPRSRSHGYRLLLVGGFVFSILLPAGGAAASLPKREGIVLYRKKCGGCHRPYAPSELRAEEWAKVLPEMEIRAKLTPDEAETIRRYLEPDLAPSHAAKPASP